MLVLSVFVVDWYIGRFFSKLSVPEIYKVAIFLRGFASSRNLKIKRFATFALDNFLKLWQ